MGLFSSKKKVTVDTTVTRLVNDNMLPYTSKTSVITACLEEGSIADSLVTGFLGCAAVKADRMFAYARDHYTHGLPNHSFHMKTNGEDVVKQAIEMELGQNIEIDYFKYAPINNTHTAWKKLSDDYEYDYRTNEIPVLSAQVGAKVYLNDIVVIYAQSTFDEAEPGAFDVWGEPALARYANHREGQEVFSLRTYVKAGDYFVDPNASVDSVEVHYTYQTASGEQVFKSFPVSMVPYDQELEYYQVQYRYLKGGVMRVGHWTYLDGSGLHSQVDAIHDVEYEKVGSYFPFTFFRSQSKNMTGAEHEYSPAYVTSTKMLKYLGLDYQSLANDIHANEGIDDIVQAIMMMAVPAEGKSQVESRYLFDYFSTMYYASPEPETMLGPVYSDSAGIVRRDGMAISIADLDFKCTLRYNGIGRRRVAGSIGDVGTCKSEQGTETSTLRYADYTTGSKQFRTVSNPYYSYQRQTTETFYEEIRVYDLTMIYNVEGKYNTVAKTGSANLLIPIDKAITDTMALGMKEELYLRSLHFVFNSMIVETTKWYQQSWFKWVLIAIAVVVTVFSGGSAGPGLWATLEAMTAAAIAWAVVTYVVQALVLQLTFKLFVKLAGPEFAMFVALVGLAVGVYGNFAEATWADSLMSMSTGLMDASSAGYQAGISSAYSSEFAEFKLMATEAQTALEDAQKLMGMGDILDPFAFIGREPTFTPGEAPQDFYNRSVHAGNMGTLGFDAISSYTQISLTLPKLSDTFGETNDGMDE
jgi:hypothetical protein